MISVRGSMRVWVRALTNGSSVFGACLSACLGTSTDQWKLVVRCVLGCVF